MKSHTTLLLHSTSLILILVVLLIPVTSKQFHKSQSDGVDIEIEIYSWKSVSILRWSNKFPFIERAIVFLLIFKLGKFFEQIS